ncbi:hypothetical protein AMATHDRAFT_8263 [Amanita thiersii Skay4041]|uniref:Conserved oligomeric Golgi complex subunit 6 n=1 Tax=Amanita thiersii Skay4041 TaxID=703135 RepID=A0A2A9NE82_9AGAR|nr:hypothetical protein AMATHDRAFT_8263 [Amanita thiersii Skay4041]
MPSLPSTSSPTPSISSLPNDKQNVSGKQQSRNPIALRLYKILGTNFDDLATRDALHTLSEFYAPGRTSVEGLPESRVEDHGTVKGSISGELASRARKNLRRDMENKLAGGSQQFLKILGEVDQKVGELQKHVELMRKSCDEAEAHLQRTQESSKDLLERANGLREEREQVEMKKLVAASFLGRFTLTAEESEAITGRDVPVGPRFFAAMDKTEQIRNDCRLLISAEGPTQAGTDIIASTSSHLEQGYDKSHRWCTNEFRSLGRDVYYEVDPVLSECVQRLRRRPELLNDALIVLSETRQATLLTSFTTALTRGGPSGLPRPIELHAHDPLRYVGDMLAWVHQAIAAEREFLESLFGLKGDGRMVGSARKFDEGSEEEQWIRELMDQSVGKLCVPLKIRVQQTIRSQESSIVSYKVANLLQFYLDTMRRTVGNTAAVSKTLEEMTDVAYKVFFDSIEALGRALLRTPLDPDDVSLTPALPILDHCQILREVMTVYQSSLLGDEDEATRASGFQNVLDTMVDPILEAMISLSEAKKRARPRWDQAVYVLNSLMYLQGVLEPFGFTSEKQAMVQQLVDGRVNLLIHEHYEEIMTDAGLKQIADICEKHDQQEPLSHLPGAQPAELQASLQKFAIWLSTPDVLHSPRLAHLVPLSSSNTTSTTNPTFPSSLLLHTPTPTTNRLQLLPHAHSYSQQQSYPLVIHHAALERMARSYGRICDAVRRGENRYEAASTVLGSQRPFGQVRLLWQIFGLEEEEEEEEGKEGSEESEGEEGAEGEEGDAEGDEEDEGESDDDDNEEGESEEDEDGEEKEE